MEYLNTIDKNVDIILENNICYSLIIVILIIYCVFSSSPKNILKLNFDNILIKILTILSILYLSVKDIRISLLLTIILLIELDKIHVKEINEKMLLLLIADSKMEEKTRK
jgi:hypothetical protein